MNLPAKIAIAAAALLLAAPAARAQSQAPAAAAMTPWDGDNSLDAPQTIGPFTVQGHVTPADPAHPDKDRTALLTLTDAQGRKGTLQSELASDEVQATLGVGRFDPASPLPQLLLTSFSGGAHCCVHVQLLDFLDGQWRGVDIGTFDGEPFARMPADLNGDGALEIVHYDDRFAYAFASYAESWMPPRVWMVRAGKVADVSDGPDFRALFVKDYAAAMVDCGKGENGACAGLVADGARIGKLDEAWAYAQEHYEPGAALPGCKVPTAGECPKDQQFGPTEFRASLTQFLRVNGYLGGS